jgi:hypothetical protein
MRSSDISPPYNGTVVKLPVISLILTVAITLFMLFGPSYTGGGFGEYKHMNAIQVNGAKALFLLIPAGVALLGLFPAFGKLPGILMLLWGLVSGWLYIAIALLMLTPFNWHTASRTSRITSAVGISFIVGLVIVSLVNRSRNFLPVHQRTSTMQETLPTPN